MRLRLIVFGLALCAGVHAEAAPVPPCAGEPSPAPTGLDDPPAVSVWLPDEIEAGWTLPDCVGWQPVDDAVLIAVAGRLRAGEGTGGLVDRLRRVSALRDVQYWSTTRNAWRPMYESVSAVTGPDGETARQDFAADELRPGSSLFFVEDRTDPLGEMVQQLTVRERSPGRLQVELTNISPATFALITVLPAGGARTQLTLEHEDGDVWRYYTLTRIVDHAPGMLAPPRESFANRAAAMFGWLAGMPTAARSTVLR
jgi:hypothetical protein